MAKNLLLPEKQILHFVQDDRQAGMIYLPTSKLDRVPTTLEFGDEEVPMVALDL